MSLSIICFGNQFIKEDNFALKLADKLNKHTKQNICVIKCNNPDDLLDFQNQKIIILDIVKNLKKTALIDVGQVKTIQNAFAHDFDLASFLKIAIEIGELKKEMIKIIGIPQNGKIEDVKKDILNILATVM